MQLKLYNLDETKKKQIVQTMQIKYWNVNKKRR